MTTPPQYPSLWVMSSLDVDIPEAFAHINGTLRWVGERGATEQNVVLNDHTSYTLPSYVRFDLALTSSDLHLIGDLATHVSFIVRNVSDERHFEPGPVGGDLPVLGRTMEIGLAQDF
jgi:phosphate uptake regulator